MDNNVDITELHKEIDLIQGCITRMSDNSFKLKEYYVTLMVVVITILLSQDCELLYVGLLALIVTCVFWGLDAFYLKMETLYRLKYKWVIEYRMQGEKSGQYNLEPDNRNMWIRPEEKKPCIIWFIFTKSLTPLYGTAALFSVVFIVDALIKHF